tara:strand:- start:25817 stop:26386 length:570 start_codon:yes stop_codon:yes gene_type:complete
MFRIDSEGATAGNRYTEGDPALSIPATVVSAEALNSFQEEIIKPIEEMGITLAKANEGQLYEALLELLLRGGRKDPVNYALANNTASAAVTGFSVLNKSTHLLRVSTYYIERKTDTQSVVEAGILFCRYNSRDDNWEQESFSLFNDAGAIFSIDDADTDAAELQVTTDDLTGASYVGLLKMTQLFEIRV